MDYRKLTKIVDGAKQSKEYVAIPTSRDGYSVEQVGGTMTVGELIMEINRFPDDDPVYFSNDGGYTYGSTRYSLDEDANNVYLLTSRDGYSVEQVGGTMTVGELIMGLDQFDEDSPIYFKNDNGYTYGAVTEVVEGEIEVEEDKDNFSGD